MADVFTAGTLVRHKLGTQEMVAGEGTIPGHQLCDWVDTSNRPHSEQFAAEWLEEARTPRPAASRPSLAARIGRFFGCR
jgi:uncharacterized protein YodC (DUF2158 family)